MREGGRGEQVGGTGGWLPRKLFHAAGCMTLYLP